MNRRELILLRERSQAFADEHLPACASELIEWADTGVLRDGKVRELSSMVSKWAGQSNALTVAEGMIKRCALEYAIERLT